MNYDIGDKIRCSVWFRNQAGEPSDPTEVTFKIRTPDGTVSEHSATRSEKGNYYYDYTITMPGVHYYRFEGTGDVVAAVEKSFTVRRSKVV